MRQLLRSVTSASHQRLEHQLALTEGEPKRDRFVALLGGFHGFHRVWEAAVGQRLHDDALLAPRERLALIEADLHALGVDAAAIAALPQCEAAAALCATEAAALGSLYVMEGSTLGGKLIARHVGAAPWCPPGGLHYFDPHGASTGMRWKQTLARLDRLPAEQWAAAGAGAIATFELLASWLADAGVDTPADKPEDAVA